MHTELNITVGARLVRELDDELYEILHGLNRGALGLMRGRLEKARSCTDASSPNCQARAIVAKDGQGQVVGWAHVHATSLPVRTKPYSRSFYHVDVSWHCHLYVSEGARGNGLGSLLLEKACDSTPGETLFVCAWDVHSAHLFTKGRDAGLAIAWHDYGSPSKFLPCDSSACDACSSLPQ